MYAQHVTISLATNFWTFQWNRCGFLHHIGFGCGTFVMFNILLLFTTVLLCRSNVKMYSTHLFVSCAKQYLNIWYLNTMCPCFVFCSRFVLIPFNTYILVAFHPRNVCVVVDVYVSNCFFPFRSLCAQWTGCQPILNHVLMFAYLPTNKSLLREIAWSKQTAKYRPKEVEDWNWNILKLFC